MKGGEAQEGRSGYHLGRYPCCLGPRAEIPQRMHKANLLRQVLDFIKSSRELSHGNMEEMLPLKHFFYTYPLEISGTTFVQSLSCQ